MCFFRWVGKMTGVETNFINIWHSARLPFTPHLLTFTLWVKWSSCCFLSSFVCQTINGITMPFQPTKTNIPPEPATRPQSYVPHLKGKWKDWLLHIDHSPKNWTDWTQKQAKLYIYFRQINHLCNIFTFTYLQISCRSDVK